MEMIDWALKYASLGWYVFPCHTPTLGGGAACSCEASRRRKDPGYQCHSPGKHPRTQRGLDEATIDPEQIREWWRQWPKANIGISCGPSGLLVLDLDNYKDNYTGHNLELNEDTVTAISGGGGAHLFYRMKPGDTFGNSRRGLPVGIDIRGHGGYVVVAPSLHQSGNRYQWEHGYGPWDMSPAALPPELRALLEASAIRRISDVVYDITPKYNGDGASPYGRRALDLECERVATAGEGGRNETLNAAAFAIGQLVGGGEIDENLALTNLVNAAVLAGLSESEAMRTAGSGLGAGKLEPRSGTAVGHESEIEAEIAEAFAVAECPDPALILTRLRYNLLDYAPEDGGILDLWFDLYGQHRLFAVGFDSWYIWQGSHWQKDQYLLIHAEIERLMDDMNQRAKAAVAMAKREDDKETARLFGQYVTATKRSKNRVASVEGMARARCAVATDTLDTSNTLNLANGVLDLDSFELRPHAPGEHLTYKLGYEYDIAAHCPRFERFVKEVLVKENSLEPDMEMVRLFQESLGYALTNDTSHEAMFWFSGDGGNGKTVAITMLQRLLGPLCVNVSFEDMGRPGNYDLAEVAGKRVIFSTESERGGKLAEGHIKRITSGERIGARPIYGTPFEFVSTAKIFWAMNDLPVVRDTSNGVWRRLKLFPFNRTFTEKDRDPHLIEKLAAELPGILNFAIDGLRSLRARGRFPESTTMAAAVEEYRHESNPVQQWIDERTQPSYTPGEVPSLYPTTAKKLFDDYRQWAEGNGRQPLNSTNFGRELRRLQIPKSKDVRGITYALELVS